MASAILRIKNDLKDINYDDYNEYIAYAELQKGHPLTVEACLIGPRSTAYEDVIFIVKIQFPDNYPNSPPTITCMAETNYHDALRIGRITTSFLQNGWTPNYTIKGILNLMLGIISMEREEVAMPYEIEYLSIEESSG